LSKDDVFLYKITRKDKDGKDHISYGLIKIGDVINAGKTSEVIHFEYKEGMLVGE
jgi:hypothetical protein